MVAGQQTFGGQAVEQLLAGGRHLPECELGVDERHHQLHPALRRIVGELTSDPNLDAVGHPHRTRAAQNAVHQLLGRREQRHRQYRRGGLPGLDLRIDQVEVDVSVGRT